MTDTGISRMRGAALPTAPDGIDTVVSALFATARRTPHAPALRWREDGQWRVLDWTEYVNRARTVAAGLGHAGVTRGDRVVLMLTNRWEFHVADIATLLLGAIPISAYNSSSPTRLRQMLGHAGASVVIAEAGPFAERIAAVTPDITGPTIVVGAGPGSYGPSSIGFAELLDFQALPAGIGPETARPDDIVTIVYTSGTTGEPKGAMLSHRNVLASARAMSTILPADDGGLVHISSLPMAHSGERLLGHYFPTLNGMEVVCCPDLSQYESYLIDVEPSVVWGPPRRWENLRAGVERHARDNATADAFEQARTSIGRDTAARRRAGVSDQPEMAAEWSRAWSHLFEPALRSVGLGRVRQAICGSAALRTELSEFWSDIGIPLSEGWGLTESSAQGTYAVEAGRSGRLGHPSPGIELRIAPDSELLLRGDAVFPGYFRDPERTATALDADGWLHTGDLGFLDDDGHLHMLGRSDDVIVTSNGKKVSPMPMENRLRLIPGVLDPIVVGVDRPYLTALIRFDPAAAPPDGLRDPAFRESLTHAVIAANDDFPPPEQIKRLAVIVDAWRPDSELLTALSKIKRPAVLARYGDLVERLYGNPADDEVLALPRRAGDLRGTGT